MKRIATIAACLLLSACAASSSFTTSAITQADVDRAQAKFPGTTLERLESGRVQYEENCQTCHGLKNPKNFSDERIRMIVPAMAEKANKKAGHVVVDSEEEVMIMQYMIAIHDRP